MRIDNVLLRSTVIEILVALWRLVERNDLSVDGLGDLNLVVKDRLHQVPVVLQNRALTGVERMGLRPTQSDADSEVTDLRIGIDAARIARHIESGNAELSACASDFHDRVENRRRLLDSGITAMTAGF